MNKKSLSRRDFLGMAGATAAGVVLSPLAPASNLGKTGVRSLAALDEPVTLSFGSDTNHPFAAVFPYFQERYPNVSATFDGTIDQPSVTAAVSAGDAPRDVLWWGPGETQTMGEAGLLLDTTDIMQKHKSNLAPAKVAECYVPSLNKYFGFAGDVGVVALYYREDLLKKAGIPIPMTADGKAIDPTKPVFDTWDDYIAAAKTIKAKIGADSIFISTAGADPAIQFQQIGAAMGASYTSPDGKTVTLDDAAGIATMKRLKTIWDANISLDALPWTPEMYGAVKTDKLAMTPGPIWWRGIITPQLTPTEGGLGQWRLSLLPRDGKGKRGSLWGGVEIAAPATTKHPEVVKKFMEFMFASITGSAAASSWGSMPPYLPFYKEQAFTGARVPMMGDFPLNEVWGAASADSPVTWTNAASSGAVVAELGKSIMPMLKGKLEIEAEMHAVAERAKAAIKHAG